MRLKLRVVGILASGLALSLPLAGCGRADEGREPGWPGGTQARMSADSIPGLGGSPAAMQRDDTIAYWEAWMRAGITSDCMNAAGLAWQPDASYPQAAIDEIVESLNVSPVLARVAVDTPEVINARVYAAMDARQKDRFARTLYGESAEDMSAFAETEIIPEGRASNFAQGGCVGKSYAKLGSVWDLKQKVGAEILAEEKIIKTSQFGTVRAAYERCAAEAGLKGVDGPEDLDAILVSATGTDAEVARTDPDALARIVETTGRVGAECEFIWNGGSAEARARALSLVYERYPKVFEVQVERYSGTLERIAADDEFLSFVATVASREQ